MQCPQCGARTAVTEKRGPFRERRCTNLTCGIDFTTREHVIPQQERNLCARTRAIKIGPQGCPSAGESDSDAEGCGLEDGQMKQEAEV
jgi:hypothetical protein